MYQNGIVTSYGDKHLNLVYNERGQIISSHHLHEDISATYNYNDNGQLAEKKFSKEVGNKQLEISTAVEYNDKDDIEKKFSKYVTVNQTDTSFQVEMYKYEYDLYNNWVKREHRGTGPVIHTQRSIYYYDGTYSGDNALISNPDHIYTEKEVDIPAQYPGGEITMAQYIANNLNYPNQAQKDKIQGRVTVSIIVSDRGDISGFKIIKGIGAECDREALRIVKLMPKGWIPAKKYGENVNSYFEINMVFKLAIF